MNDAVNRLRSAVPAVLSKTCAMTYVFVYGTLKRGDCRHRYLAGSHFCGPTITSQGYRLFDLGSFPGLVEAASTSCVAGELYRVSSHTLAVLDEVEAVADHLFVRRPIRLQAPHAEVEAQAYFYLGDVSRRRELVRSWPVGVRL
jgi:gamma-glutamylaminecyclotransferase